jgi:outer membrane protein OmpA-like peptidoglycan-associated protein/opacity protein-like surface antigen
VPETNSREEEFGMRNLLMFTASLLMLALPAMAQNQSAPKAEIFAGYSYLKIDESLSGAAAGADTSVPAGFNVDLAFNPTRLFGFVIDFQGHFKDFDDPGGTIDARTISLHFGPRLKLRSGRAEPFVHGLFGFTNLHAEQGGVELASESAFSAKLGGGLDVVVSDHLALRLGEFNYYLTRFADTRQNNYTFSTGLVFRLGGGPPPTPPSAACSANPTAVFAGEPVQVTVAPRDFNPKHTLNYSWKASGGKVQGEGAKATVDTAGLNPGSYTVSSTVTSAKRAKDTASCNASFTVKERPKNPPTISCSASPGTVQSGTPSTITCQCSSPDNAADYPVETNISNWTASGGKVSGTGNTATLDTAGAPAGPITVTATCTDNRGLTADGTTTVNVEVPPPPPQASQINSIDFKRNSARVDNTAKAILDDVALRLQREADATAVVVGYADPQEKGKNLAAQRALNTTKYLVDEKGIDASRIESRSSSNAGMKADIYLVPAGATFDEPGTQVVTAPPAAPAKRSKPQ